MTYELFVSHDAQVDLLNLEYFYEMRKVGLGHDLRDEVLTELSKIQQAPLQIQVRYDDFRISFLKRFPVGIHFYLSDTRIIVTSIIHTKASPESWIRDI